MNYRILTYLIFVLLFTSCAVHYGTVNGTMIPSSEKGIVYKDKVYGYASCEYIFLIGGMGKQGLAEQALSNLQMSVELQDGEYLDNFTINHKKFYFAPLFIRHEVLVSADKIQSMDSFPVRYDSTYNQHVTFSKSGELPFTCNEKVYFYKNSNYANPTANIIVQPGTDDSKTIMKGDYGGVEVRSSDNSSLFKRNATHSIHSFLGFKEGDSIDYQLSSKSVGNNVSAELLGSNGSHLLVRYGTVIDVTHKNRVIMEEVLSDSDQQLNKIMLELLKREGRNEPVVFRDKNEDLSFGRIEAIDKSNVSIMEDDKIVEVPISQIYTLRNWLVVSSHKYSFREFYKGNNLIYYDDLEAAPIEVKIVGFRYFNVLVVADDGELREVPIGKLFSN